ncbi:probable methyltransferase-like protein 15 homolog [Chelonus insularis]|uniref:probable methyltransferase-like protein 15 homolog n=1 Tax=Chelonus insularis TaxID=460826 RepID=UPI00158EF2A2|nr:probable methyltransferase-like protein 15 homolog [Chelonus insularis]
MMRNLIRSKQYFYLVRRCLTQLALEPSLSSPPHIPVMAKEVIQYLKPSEGETFVDMTFGAGGHTKRILQSAPNIKVFALDRDPVAHNYAKELAEKYPGQIIPLLGRFSELPALLKKKKVLPNTIDGFLFDFGCSSMQFDVADRGFAISKNGPLDMRMDGDRYPDEPTAADVLDRISEEHLYRVIKYYGEEKMARKIAQAIIETRYTYRNLRTTWELASLVNSVLEDEVRTDKLGRPTSKATKVFQALRIFVNNELNEINYGMIIAHKYLKLHGRLVALSFHSLEDTVVKRHLAGNVTDYVANRSPLRFTDCGRTFTDGEMEMITDSPWKMLHQHVILPNDQEVEENPRSRSVKFRAMAKVK